MARVKRMKPVMAWAMVDEDGNCNLPVSSKSTLKMAIPLHRFIDDKTWRIARVRITEVKP